MIRLIAATDIKRGIAKQGRLPWDIPEDAQYFREQTLLHGAVVLMGRRTFEQFKHPLPNRRNLVVSHTKYALPGVETVNDIVGLLNDYQGDKDIWVIGGEALYQSTLSYASELYITKIAADFACDQFFPEYESTFELVYESEPHSQNGFDFRYTRYAKKAATSKNA